MEIVIKIKDKLLKDLNNEGLNPCMVIGKFDMHIADAIKNGTVLPKGHGDLIDRDKISPQAYGTKAIWGAVLKAPTIIEAD